MALAPSSEPGERRMKMGTENNTRYLRYLHRILRRVWERESDSSLGPPPHAPLWPIPAPVNLRLETNGDSDQGASRVRFLAGLVVAGALHRHSSSSRLADHGWKGLGKRKGPHALRHGYNSLLVLFLLCCLTIYNGPVTFFFFFFGWRRQEKRRPGQSRVMVRLCHSGK